MTDAELGLMLGGHLKGGLYARLLVSNGDHIIDLQGKAAMEGLAAINRLATRVAPLLCWRGLLLRSDSLGLGSFAFEELLARIGAIVADTVVSMKENLPTPAKARADAEEAARLASQLANLLDQPFLQPTSVEQLIPKEEVAAMNRIMMGVSLQHLTHHPLVTAERRVPPHPRFSDSVEERLNRMHALTPDRFCSSTPGAVGYFQYSRAAGPWLQTCLRNLAKHAGAAYSDADTATRPSARVRERRAATRICALFKEIFDEPLLQLSADLTSAMFDRKIDADDVKDWRKARR